MKYNNQTKLTSIQDRFGRILRSLTILLTILFLSYGVLNIENEQINTIEFKLKLGLVIICDDDEIEFLGIN